MIIILIIVAVIVIVFFSNWSDNKEVNQAVPFDSAFTSRIGQDPASYICSKMDSGSDFGAIRYLFEVIEAEIEKKSKCKSPGFDFYYLKAIGKQEKKQLSVSPRKPVVIENTPVNKGQRHHWTIEEDTLCCRRFFEQYVTQHSSMDLQILSVESTSLKVKKLF